VKYTKTIANHILKGSKKQYSRLIINISITSIAIGVAVMLLAMSIVTGFQKTIRDKVSGFGAHITITHYDLNQSYESEPIALRQPYIGAIKRLNNVRNIQPYANKAGIIKQKEAIEGIVLKGVDSTYNWDYMKQTLRKGEILGFDSASGKKIMISKIVADKLGIEVGDKVSMYFIQDPPRMRAYTICGIFETGMSQFDAKFAFVNIDQIRKLNNWEKGEVDGFEIVLRDFSKIRETAEEVSSQLPYDQKSQTIIETNPDLFDWIGMFDTNMYILIGLIVIISTITVISTLLILILEQSTTIGILKAMGANHHSITKIFVQVAGTIILKGMIIGNTVALSLSLIQKYTHLIPLKQDLYYMDAVPINLNPLHYLLINAGVFVITSFFAYLPIYAITRKISTIQAIRYQ
jgi:lipoprotein-releasing system permease protein